MTAQAPQGALPTPSDLSERLRYQTRYTRGLVPVTMNEAADHIDAQARQIADLERHCAGLGDENTRALRGLAAAQQALADAEGRAKLLAHQMGVAAEFWSRICLFGEDDIDAEQPQREAMLYRMRAAVAAALTELRE